MLGIFVLELRCALAVISCLPVFLCLLCWFLEGWSL